MSIPEAQLPAFLVAERVLVYNCMAAGAFLMWDQCITFGQEVELIWQSRFNIVNFLFLFIRYFALAIRIAYFVYYLNTDNFINPSVATCVNWLWFKAFSGLILSLPVQVLLIIRVFALYERNKGLLVCLSSIFVLVTVAQLVIIGMVVPRSTTIPSPFPHTLDPSACLLIGVPDILKNFWVPGLIFGSILFILVAAKFVQAKRERDDLDSSNILVVLVRDGTWAFVFLLALFLWACLAYELSAQKGDIALTWIYSILALCGTRLTLNLRMVADAEREREVDTGTEFKVCSRSEDAEETETGIAL